MLDQSQRTAILALREKGHGVRPIARALGISRQTVREVLESGSALVPPLCRSERAESYREEILAQPALCKGNLVRVHEELCTRGAQLSYAALTAFCRKHGIGYQPPRPAGRYVFAPGQEMQHDTSAHKASIGGPKRVLQTASLVACYSHLIFIQLYPRFRRFECKLFLTDAFLDLGGACEHCGIDNTHVVVLFATGKHMVPAPEMAAFAERFHFTFQAHEVGDADRSGRVEAPMSFIENNFYAGRSFADFDDGNRQAVTWCDQVNAKFIGRWHASRRELFAAERPPLRPLPLWVPPVYQLAHRIVDIEGYVNLHRHQYSVPYRLIGRQLEVRETKDRVEVYDGPRQLASHPRVVDARQGRSTLPEHRPPRGQGRSARHGQSVEEEQLLRLEPRLADYIATLKRKVGGQGVLPLRRLLRMLRDYPRAPFWTALDLAQQYGLYDLARLERLVLRHVGRETFVLPSQEAPPENDHEEK
jgi:hypothetical protein